ncbi:uncharacterized protein LOC131841271 [Achroia grisella]|uniref:uncharacterized protein LOC131841271 n=1 Tax=Achroia grisella TaxID=688607 RepID=UPI0027D2B0B4|nr:uncharacterized protein LOC131841271 [Achroia grisella]
MMVDDEDDYDDDELPTIIVNGSLQQQSEFIMPSAEALASERAREKECEREIEQMRCEHEATARFAHSDSSSSESEVLSAAVEALQVQSTPPSLTRPDPSHLLGDLLQLMRPEHSLFIRDYLDMIQHADSVTIDHITYDATSSILWSVSAAAMGAGTWGEAEIVGVGAWLCAACLWGEPAHPSPSQPLPSGTTTRPPRTTRARLRRALHCLLDIANPQHVQSLTHVMVRAVKEPLARLELAEAAGGGELTSGLLHAALRDLLSTDSHQEDSEPPGRSSPNELAELVCSRWRSLSADARYAVVQVASRALLRPAAADPSPDASAIRRLLAEISHPISVPLADRHRPEHLKVLVAASKLQLLFRGKKQD